MRKEIYLLLTIVALYLVTSLVLSLIYGASFSFLSGEDCWIPNGHGGWQAHGHPTDQPPAEPSVAVPLLMHYLPIFIPALVLILFTLTPLRRKLETPKPKADSE